MRLMDSGAGSCAACRTRVAGLSRGQRRRNRLESRISPTRMTSGSCRSADRNALVNEACRPTALADHRPGGVKKLDGVMIVTIRSFVAIDIVHHGGQGRGFSRTRRPGHEHEASRRCVISSTAQAVPSSRASADCPESLAPRSAVRWKHALMRNRNAWKRSTRNRLRDVPRAWIDRRAPSTMR